MPKYIHQSKDWPEFRWNRELIEEPLASVRHQQGRLIGRMEGLGFQFRTEASFQSLTQEVLKTSEIEGEILSIDQVRSSLARKLGLDVGALKPSDRNVDGVVEMLLDATQNFDQQLTAKRLFGWHSSLFPTGWSGTHKMKPGSWRKGSVAVVSGRGDRERIHFEGPEAKQVPTEMREFLKWFDQETKIDPVIKAGLAHLWFVTIHPFDDGNGRIARAIADMALARSEGASFRFYSMSAQIRAERKQYYEILESTTRGSMDITEWLHWFLICLDRAIIGAQKTVGTVLAKSDFWKSIAGAPLNERQHKILNRFLDEFEGKLTSSKWAKLAKCSQDTANRDIADLVERGILIKDAAGVAVLAILFPQQ